MVQTETRERARQGLVTGQQVGNYVVEEEIAVGGMARLYRVRHAVLGTTHALKALEPAYRARPELRSRFLAEAVIGARLVHPHVVRVTDTVATDEVAGIVMELVPGRNLEQHLQGGALPPELLRRIFGEVLAAVGEAHRRGIVHRDLKPANILLQEEGGPGRLSRLSAKVSDFGIAKELDLDDESARRRQRRSTAADARMGTLSYMSPEQIRRAKEVTPRSDIFSLGATLYEMATGRPAFDGESDYDVMHRIVEASYQPLPETVDPQVAQAIARALRPRPEERFASCEEFAAALAPPPPPAPSLPPPAKPIDPIAPIAPTISPPGRSTAPYWIGLALLASLGGNVAQQHARLRQRQRAAGDEGLRQDLATARRELDASRGALADAQRRTGELQSQIATLRLDLGRRPSAGPAVNRPQMVLNTGPPVQITWSSVLVAPPFGAPYWVDISHRKEHLGTGATVGLRDGVAFILCVLRDNQDWCWWGPYDQERGQGLVRRRWQ